LSRFAAYASVGSGLDRWALLLTLGLSQSVIMCVFISAFIFGLFKTQFIDDQRKMLSGNIAGQVDNFVKFTLAGILAARANKIYVEVISRERNHDMPTALSSLLADVIEPGEFTFIVEQIFYSGSLFRLITQSSSNDPAFGRKRNSCLGAGLAVKPTHCDLQHHLPSRKQLSERHLHKRVSFFFWSRQAFLGQVFQDGDVTQWRLVRVICSVRITLLTGLGLYRRLSLSQA
jgi:hypothetical protein